ncbi:ADP-ribosylglycohydrolase family protein [Kitasatospora sp. MAP5-34]|uniref:ADP-ribosylglycohydrolase family protein n=1 Tax=Kitasatospora sp. MAP5-34 TaxID=3035102 RepID=UPI0024765CF8|nr:ADP-ribosylglycohydrolase family protein [Kitasatospora sp. MAP5-34]MDH6578404.1 ADP-ribosylglycohydrolase [Kitasatospora sp. MAP5-34]
MVEYAERVRGALLGGSLGDALGWPIEFDQLEQIRQRFGPDGLTDLRAAGRGGQVTDDTQMTLFTAEGLIRGRADGAQVPVAMHQAYQRWLLTQNQQGPEAVPPTPPNDGWLLRQPFLYASRAPGNACTSGIAHHRTYRRPAPFGQDGPINPNSKGCGTVMRSAPFGLARLGVEWSFWLSAQCSQLTHGHPTGYLAAGAFSALIERVTAGVPLSQAVTETIEQVAAYPSSEETVEALRRAVRVAAEGVPSAEAVERVGLGWIAEECLAIAVYCALAGRSAAQALVLSVNHSGDSDSTGAVCGNLVGALYGEAALPAEWLAVVEGREVVTQVADDLVAAFGGNAASLGDRYPA